MRKGLPHPLSTNPPHTYYTPTIYRTQKDSNVGVFSCSASFHHPYNTCQDEMTPSLVFFGVQHCSFSIQYTLSMKRHQRGCHFVSSVVPQYNTHRAQKTPSLMSFCVWCLLYALEHVSAPMLVCFCFRHLSYPLPHMLNMKKHHCWCAFIFSDFHTPPTH